MDNQNVQEEFQRRVQMWERLLQEGGPRGVKSTVLRYLNIYAGQHGIWVDKSTTNTVAEIGVTVSLKHSGRHYDDDFMEDGLIYHYPETRRKGTDRNQIQATKKASELGLPVFVITETNSNLRDVYVGWVVDWDDATQQFLVLFSEQKPDYQPTVQDTPFNLFEPKQTKKSVVNRRTRQAKFRFEVTKRYGEQCALCNLHVSAVLDAVHIVDKSRGGSDDPRNALVLCATHHRAFDNHLIHIEPETFRIVTDYGLDELNITNSDLSHLRAMPSSKALEWRWNAYKK